MSDKHEQGSPLIPDAAETPSVGVTPSPLVSPRRRRLIRLGASSVPVAMTLASRPVHAWACNTTSAWGSAANATGSAKTRMDGKKIGNEGWGIGTWASTGCTGWTTCGTKKYSNTAAYARTNLRVSDLYGGAVGNAAGSTKVFTYLSGKTTDDLAACLLVAKLNLFYASGSAGHATCLNSGTNDLTAAGLVLNAMANGTYKPSNGSAVWSQQQIKDYLFANYMVRA